MLSAVSITNKQCILDEGSLNRNTHKTQLRLDHLTNTGPGAPWEPAQYSPRTAPLGAFATCVRWVSINSTSANSRQLWSSRSSNKALAFLGRRRGARELNCCQSACGDTGFLRRPLALSPEPTHLKRGLPVHTRAGVSDEQQIGGTFMIGKSGRRREGIFR